MRVFWAILWKEWLGLRWKLAALTAIPVGSVLGLLAVDATLIPTSLIPLFIAYGAIAPIFMAMHAAAEDNSAGTLEFVRGLPVPLFQFGMIRIIGTLTVLLAPLLAATTTVWILKTVSAWWPFGGSFAAFSLPSGLFLDVVVPTVAGMAAAASLFLWTTALAMNQPSELRAGLIGVVTAIGWGVWTMFTVAQWDNGPGNWTWLYGITSLGPFASLVLLDPGLTFAGLIAMGLGHLAGMGALTVIAARRYGILERRRPASGWRLSSPSTALWWMQWRQASPIGVAGLTIILGLSMFRLAVTTSTPHHDDLARFESMLYWWSIGMGAVWAILVAAPLFAADLEPKLSSFWRSRPIDPSDWFRIKFLTGACTFLLFIDLPAALLGKHLDASKAESVAAYLVCVPPLHLAVYGTAVLIACLVRHVIYAGILALGMATFVILLPTLTTTHGVLSALHIDLVIRGLVTANAGGRLDLWLMNLAIYLTFTLSIAVTTTLLARWAVQKDLAVRM